MENIEAWIALDQIPGIGPRTVGRLLEDYADAATILSTPSNQLKDRLNANQLAALRKGPLREPANVLKQLSDLGARAISRQSPLYPAELLQLADPPTVLYIKGELNELQPAVAMVGTRAPSRYGAELAQDLAAELSACGVSVVSGLARGIDTAAHRGSLMGSGKAVAALGSGLDQIYPRENAQLAEAISKRGALITEFAPGAPPESGNFPRRNRLIAALSLGVIVIEATLRSGAMITARLAGEQGRTVMATPGAVTNPRSQGPHQLIRQGAALIENAQDVLREIAPQLKACLKPAATSDEPILSLLKGSELLPEEIASSLNASLSTTVTELSRLEIAGLIEKTAAGRYARRSQDA